MEKKIIIRPMTWDEHERFIDEVEVFQPDTESEEFQSKSTIEKQMTIGAFNRKQSKWIFDNIYNGHDINNFTMAEIILIAQKTIMANISIRNEDLKNLLASYPGQDEEGKSAETAQKSMSEPEKNSIATPAPTDTQMLQTVTESL